ncbi:MAG TPA: PBP1A family penicillin-binding protein [Thermoanaerobaculia bacterium]|nr:PBP1A family penicillin-binding protein [Thermoanaerobaculia bacterium]
MATPPSRKLRRTGSDRPRELLDFVLESPPVTRLRRAARHSPVLSRLAAAVPPSRARDVRRRLLQLALVLALGALAGVGVAAVIHIPSVDALGEFAPSLITEVRAADGSVFKTYAHERRMLLEEGEVPATLRNVLLAAEDKNFYRHGGLDLAAIVRSSLIDLREGRLATGASTITMQLARTYFQLNREKWWRRKIEEALLTVELEKRLSKEQILTLYCNVQNLGEGRYGFKAASRYYFGKDVGDLGVAEAATLTAILPAPSRLSPYRRPDEVTQRRNVILGRVLREGMITREEYEVAAAAPLGLVQRERRPEPGRHLAEEVRRHLEAEYGVESIYARGLQVHTTLDLAMQRAAERVVRDGLAELDRRKGWRAATYRLEEVDPAVATLPSWPEGTARSGEWYEGIVLEVGSERAAIRVAGEVFALDRAGVKWTGAGSLRRLLEPGDVAWFEVLPDDQEEKAGAGGGGTAGEPGERRRRVALRQEPEMEAALVLLESSTGAVRAMVGGWDFGRSQFNRATQARRQVGSAFKPLVYGAAIEAGYTPADTLFDAPVIFPGATRVLDYSPRNYKRRYLGILTLRRALEDSINVTATKLLDLVGVERVIEFAQRCGITSPLPPYPSLALGTADLIPVELASAFATLGNQGMRIEPYFIEYITTRDGTVLEEHAPRASQVVSPEVAYVLTHMLRGVIQRGTGGSAASLGLDLAGKTGTTDSYTDAWFVGYTPRYTLLVWVGYDQKRYLGRGMTGAVAALPMWRAMLARGVEQGWIDADARFARPPGVTMRRVEYYTGLLAAEGSERTIEEAFVEGTEPAQAWDRSWSAVIALPWYQQRPFYGAPKVGERMPEDIDDWGRVLERWRSMDDDEGADHAVEPEPTA